MEAEFISELEIDNIKLNNGKEAYKKVKSKIFNLLIKLLISNKKKLIVFIIRY